MGVKAVVDVLEKYLVSNKRGERTVRDIQMWLTKNEITSITDVTGFCRKHPAKFVIGERSSKQANVIGAAQVVKKAAVIAIHKWILNKGGNVECRDFDKFWIEGENAMRYRGVVQKSFAFCRQHPALFKCSPGQVTIDGKLLKDVITAIPGASMDVTSALPYDLTHTASSTSRSTIKRGPIRKKAQSIAKHDSPPVCNILSTNKENCVVVATKRQLHSAITTIKREIAVSDIDLSVQDGKETPIVAIDCEGVPNTLALLQLAIQSGCWLFDCIKLGAGVVCESLKWLLESPNVLKLAHDVHCDVYALHQHGIHPEMLLDTQLGYELDHRSQTHVGLAELLQKYDLKHTTKNIMHKTMAEDPKYWLKRPMSDTAIQYAAADVNLRLQVGEQMVAHLSKPIPTQLLVALEASKQRERAVADYKIPNQRAIAFDTTDKHRLCSRELLLALDPTASVDLQPVHIDEKDTESLLHMLPTSFAHTLEDPDSWKGLTDVILDVGRRPQAFYGKSREFLHTDSDDEVSDRMLPASEVLFDQEGNRLVTQEDIDEVVENIGGVDKFGSDNRAGLDRSLHRISALRDRANGVIGLTMRAGRTVTGGIGMISDILFNTDKSVLVMGEPGSGKTTIIREIAKTLADEVNVLIVDTSNEIAGDGTVPHHCIGLARRVQVPELAAQGRVMVECVQNHTPSVMIIDEIGRPAEVASARTVKQRGVRIIASAHGDMRKLSKNTQLSALLGDRQSSIRTGGDPVTNRVSDPIFDVIVELKPENRNEWVVILDTATAVDKLLKGGNYPVQRRIREEHTGLISMRLERG